MVNQLSQSRQLVLGEIIGKWARKDKHREALVFKDKRFTYGEFDERINRLANGLQDLGIRKGDKVSVLFLNGNEILEVYFATARLGAVSVPLNFRLVGPELKYQVENSDSKAVIYGERFAPLMDSIRDGLEKVSSFICTGNNQPENVLSYENIIDKSLAEKPLVYVDDDDPAFIMYTSGTTGKPKGAVMTHKNLVMDTMNLLVEIGIRGDDRYLCVPPLFHTAALALAVSNIYVGAAIIILEEFNPPEIPQILQDEQITQTFLVPAMWIFLLQVPDIESYDLKHLRLAITGAAVMPVEVKNRIMKRFPASGVYDVFGQTEMSPCTTMLKPQDAMRKQGSVGRPIINVDVRVVGPSGEDVPAGEIGEIVYQGPTVMKEYYKNPGATEEAFRGGWFRSGDLVRQDEEGFVYVVDRSKDMIISGGENIYSAEVEEVLFQHEKILEAAIIGVPDEKWGESVKAVIVPAPGTDITEEEVTSHCKEFLAGYKKPRSVEIIDALPRNAAGKVLKFKLRQQFSN